MDLTNYIEYLVSWLKSVKEETKAKGFIVGLSGGIDSALVAALIKRATNEDCLGLILPCHSNKLDKEDAILVAKALNIKTLEIDLSSTFDDIAKKVFNLSLSTKETAVSLAKGNTKARLRMTTLYAIGQSLGYLVVGTDNMAEWFTGYFTKFGDGGVDLVPIIHLTKGQVKEASRLLGVPEKIINRVPTAGLYEGQTDEGELGMTYDEIDAYLLGKDIGVAKTNRLLQLHRISEHKRNLALQPKPFNK